jgi:hypothetical protein
VSSFKLNILDGIDETLTGSYSWIPYPASATGTRRYILERSEGNVRRTGAGRNLQESGEKRPCPSKTEIPEIRNYGWREF